MSSEPRRLRVVIDGAILSRPPTGTARWVRGLAAALSRLPDLETSVVSGPSYIRAGGRLHRVPNLLRERWWYERGLPAAARRLQADAVLAPANLSARRDCVPQVVTILDVNFLSEPGTYERTFVRYATWAYLRSIRDAARITTISSYSRTEISRHLGVDPSRISVVYPGLDATEPGILGASPHHRPYALFAGATERHKNIRLLLDAWRDRSPAGLDLVLVGQPGRDHAMAVASAGRTGGRVIVRGRVPEEDMDRWYRHASVFLFPSKVEGFGFPPLEAMQRGIPVVSSTGGSLPEVLGDAALYVDPDDVAGVVRQTDLLMSDQELRTGLINRGIAKSASYTWSASARSMDGVIRDAVGHAPIASSAGRAKPKRDRT